MRRRRHGRSRSCARGGRGRGEKGTSPPGTPLNLFWNPGGLRWRAGPDDPVAGVEVARPREPRRHRLAVRSEIPATGQDLPGLRRSPHGAGNTRRLRRPRLELPRSRRPMRPEPLPAVREAATEDRHRRCDATADGSGGTKRDLPAPGVRRRLDARPASAGAPRGRICRRTGAASQICPSRCGPFRPGAAAGAVRGRRGRAEGNPCPCRQGRHPSWPRP